MDDENSNVTSFRPANTRPEAVSKVSKLATIQAQFQKKQQQQKEQKLQDQFQKQQLNNNIGQPAPAVSKVGAKNPPITRPRAVGANASNTGTVSTKTVSSQSQPQPQVNSSLSYSKCNVKVGAQDNRNLKASPSPSYTKLKIGAAGNKAVNAHPSTSYTKCKLGTDEETKAQKQEREVDHAKVKLESTKQVSTAAPFPTVLPKAPPSSSKNSFCKPAVTPNAGASPVKASTPKPNKVQHVGPPPDGTVECSQCGRYFTEDRIAKHETICKKSAAKKRKVFNPTAMRLKGTEAEPYLKKLLKPTVLPGSSKKPASASTPTPAIITNTSAAAGSKKSDWRKKHEDFIRTIRAAKEYQQHVASGGNPKDLPPPPPSDYSDYVQCPHCSRKFNAGVAQRHIPKCQSIKSNKRR